jgi:hypothetical protein
LKLAQKEIAELKNQLHQTKEKMTRERAKRSSAEGKKEDSQDDEVDSN